MMRDSTLRGHQVSNEFDEERRDRGEPPIVFDDDADSADARDAAAATKRNETQADILIGLATSAALFHTPAPDRDGYAEIVIEGRRETYRVHSKPFRDWLRFQYYKKTKRGCNSDAMKVAVETLAAKAAFECPEHPVFDPRLPDRRALPKIEDDLITAAKGVHVLNFDNISGMPDWLSDAFCRLSTGGGAGKRKLYSDDDEILFDGRRPVLLNGIEVVNRGDLVDRANILSLEVIPEDRRLTEAELDAAFEQAAPKIFGALLDGLVTALRNLPTINMTEKPRMADFVLFAEAGTRAFYPAGTFTAAYRGNMAAAVEMVIEASPVGTPVRKFMEVRPEWSGTAEELLKLLSDVVGEPLNKAKGWPKLPHILSGKLKWAATSLRKIGIHVAFVRRSGPNPRIRGF